MQAMTAVQTAAGSAVLVNVLGYAPQRWLQNTLGIMGFPRPISGYELLREARRCSQWTLRRLQAYLRREGWGGLSRSIPAGV